MNTTCIKCSKKFNVKLEEKYLGAMLTEIFFKCPECKKKYLVGIQNNKCRRLQLKIDLINKEILNKKSKNITHIEEILEVEKLTEVLKKEMDHINGK